MLRSALNKLKVKDIMTKNVFTVNLQHTWKDAARKLSAKNIHHLVVVDENHIPVTVMSVTDFLKIALSDDENLKNRKLEDVRPHHRLISVKSEDMAYEAINEMNNHLIESVIVLNKSGQLEGIVTTKDLMNTIFFDERFKD